MARGRQKKDEFADLPEEFKDAVANASEEEINTKLATIALSQQELIEAKQSDEDFQQAKAALAVAGEVYREGAKANKLKIRFIKKVLESRGRR